MSDTAVSENKGLVAGYAPASAVKLFMDKMRQGTISGPIDRDLLKRIGVKDSLTKRTLSTLRTLDLVDADGRPSAACQTLINARPDQYQESLAQFVRQAYEPVFQVLDPATATGEALTNAFWGYEPRGQIDTMIRLFLALCEEAGIVAEKPVLESRPRKTATPAATPSSNGGGTQTKPPTGPRSTEGYSQTVDLGVGAILTINVTGNPLTFSKAERDLVFDLADKINAYRERKALPSGQVGDTS